jgi:DNA-binding response OmpR family regulator
MATMPKKVLIAEDEDHIRTAIKLAIDMEGYEIYEAMDGQETLDIAQRVRPDLLILDVMMPRLDGFQVCQTLKADKELRNIYVLFLSARSRQKTREAVQACGGDDFLEKPFSIRELREKIIAVLGENLGS